MRVTLIAVLGLVTTSACTTLGPMPATTGISAIPAARPEAEVQVGAMPAYYLSAGAARDPEGAAVPQLLALFDPDHLLLPGLIVAARGVSSAGAGSFIEPMLGYRANLTDRFAGAIIIYGTHASGAQNSAHFSAGRFGGELQADVRVSGESRWAELHVGWGVSLTGLSGDGHYCVDADGYGTDCNFADHEVDIHASGAYLAANAAVALELFRHHESWFHGGRVALGVAGGTMPTYRNGIQTDAAVYGAVGLTLSVAVGAAERRP
jgi:hypothetical protein